MTPAEAPRVGSAKVARWAGHLLSTLLVAQLLFSAAMKLVLPQGVPEHYTDLGWPMQHIAAIAFIEIVCTCLYLVPRTAVMGAILLTGYLGGAIATHVRVADGVFWYPLALGILLWGGLYLRSPRQLEQSRGLRGLIPFVS